jgi:carbon-monoxide dehydrogenase medium subunit
MINMSINAQSVLPAFEYIKPKTLSEASQFLAEHAGEARPFLGGTDTFVRMRDGDWKDAYLVDVKGLDGTEKLTYSASKGLTIGAGVSMNRVSAFPDVKKHYSLLAEVVDTVASYQLRTRATIVGNICNASPAGDTIGACLLYDGVLHVHGVKGQREESLSSFFVGPGETVLKPGDIVTAIALPPPPKGLAGAYLKHGRNKLGDLAIVGVTVVAHPDKSTKSGYRFRLALASVAPTPLIVEEVEAILGEEIAEVRIAEAAQTAMDACNPIDDVRASARYRQMMVRNLSQKALSQVWAKLKD